MTCAQNFSLALIAGSLLTGCMIPQPQSEPVVAENNAQYDQISHELASLCAVVAAAADRTQTQLSDGVETKLTDLGEELSTIRAQVAACSAPPEMQPISCDSPDPVVMHDERMVVGEVEWVTIEPPGFVLNARIDTGAQSSSIHAENLTQFERDGDDWVRFELTIEEEVQILERPILRHVRVYQQSDKEGSRRPVVEMRVIVGNVADTFDFTLADRAHLEHDMILGRNFLTDLALVDVGRQYIQPLPE